MEWTDELDATIRRKRHLGMDYEAIGKDMGLTKGQVIGRARRIGISGNPKPSGGKGPIGWSDDPAKKKLALELRAQGWSFLNIGKAVGVSKNQVSGVASREKWPAPVRINAPKAEQVNAVRAPVITLEPLAALSSPIIVPEVVPMPPAKPPPAPKLSDRTCSYPTNDGILEDGRKGWTFCDQRAVFGKSYCAEHLRVCTTVPRDRREEAAA